MKTIRVEELDHRVADTLNEPGGDEVVLLTEHSAALGLLLRVPKELKNSEIDVAVWLHGPDGAALFVVQPKGLPRSNGAEEARPQFGSCRGMLKVIAEDDEHLKDFDEYMR